MSALDCSSSSRCIFRTYYTVYSAAEPRTRATKILKKFILHKHKRRNIRIREESAGRKGDNKGRDKGGGGGMRENTSPEEALSAFSTWGAVHGTSANYTRMALTLVDTHFRQSTATAPVQPAPPTQATKRPRAESTSSYESGSESSVPIPALSSLRAPRFKAAAGRQPPLPATAPPRGVSKAAVGQSVALAA